MRRARRLSVRALLLSALAGVAGQAWAAPPSGDPWAYRFHACADSEVRALVGKPRDAALAQVKDMNIKILRVLAPDSVVLTAPDPQRLTLVIAPNGIVTRAFCR